MIIPFFICTRTTVDYKKDIISLKRIVKEIMLCISFMNLLSIMDIITDNIYTIVINDFFEYCLFVFVEELLYI